MSYHDNPYDAAEQAAYDDDLRQRWRDEEEERMVERWKAQRYEAPEMQSRSIIGDDGNE